MEYELQQGHYQFVNQGSPLGPALPEVALALDLDTGCVLKHGDPRHVRAWYDQAHQAFMTPDDQMPDDLARLAQQMAQALVMIQGQIPLDDLNKCLSISGYAGRWYAQQGEHLQRVPQGTTLQ